MLAVVALAKGCGDGESPSAPPTPEPARPTTVAVSPATHELTAFGATVQLMAEVRDQNARVMAGATVTWTSSASSVATVDASGLVTAVGNGTATITASAGSASGSAVVTVTQSVASVEVSPATAPLTALGETVQLTAEAFDGNGHAVAGAEFSWESSDVAVATVNASGLVTAAGKGTATITASAGSASGSAVVTVTQSVASVEVSPSAQTIALGSTLQLMAEAFDENGHAVAGLEFSWESSDVAVATVNASGLVTAAGKGTATITASAGSASGSAVVTVTPTFTLSGTVSDSRRNGPMLAGAVVRLQNGRQESMTTGPDGRYSFQNVRGTVTVTVTAEPSYVAETVEVTVDADRTVDFALEHTGIPPFAGTVWITPNILDASDPTSLRSVTYAGRGERTIYDRRPDMWITVDAYLFDAQYDGQELEFQVNPEFGSVEAAQTEVEKYAPAIGRLPTVLLSRARKVHINAGHELFGGNAYDRSFLIHTGHAEEVLDNGFLEEVLFHEAGHVSLDLAHANAPGWRTAQQVDGVFISDYARDFPDREDVAESIIMYFAVRYRPERLSEADRAAILAAIPNRLVYFDEQGLDMSPYAATESIAPVLAVTPFQPQPRIWRPFEGPRARPGPGR